MTTRSMTRITMIGVCIGFPLAIAQGQRGTGDDILDHRVQPAPPSAVQPRGPAAETPVVPVTPPPEQTPFAGRPATDLQVDQVIEDWSAESQAAVRNITQQYGQPDEVTRQRMVWNDAGPWTRTVVVNEETPTDGILYQTVEYEVPPGRIAELAELSDDLTVDRSRGELTARGDSEEANFLSINLAHQIIEGEIDAQEARERHALAMAGEDYGDLRQGLVFEVPGEPDVQFGLPPREREGLQE